MAQKLLFIISLIYHYVLLSNYFIRMINEKIPNFYSKWQIQRLLIPVIRVNVP